MSDRPISLGRLTITDKSVWRDKSRQWRAVLIGEEGRDLAEGFGRTATVAKEELARIVTTALRFAGIDPLMVATPHGFGAIIFASDGMFRYRIYRDGQGLGGSCGSWDNRREAEIRCRRHLAQMVFDVAPDDGGMDVLHPNDDEGRMEHARWLAWQRAYAKAAAKGLDDHECRTYADKETA